jgi:hypothetical protein
LEDTRKELTPGEMLIEATGEAYELVEEGQPLPFHIETVGTVMGKNYNTGEPEKKLDVRFKLDAEGPAQGQVYSQWFTPSISERSNLAKLLKAVFGEVPVPFDPTRLVGLPLQATLVNKTKDGSTRQYIDTFLKPAAGQKKVQKDVVPEDVDDQVSLDDIDF